MASSAMPPGSQYKTIEDYLYALERRQELEKAPTAAVFMLGSWDMMMLEIAGHPWLTRVRCELPTRPLGPSGEEDPIKATFVGGNNKDDADEYKQFVAAMALIDVTRCCHLKITEQDPSHRALAHLEQSDIVVLGDGPHVQKAWWNMNEASNCALVDRIKWRYYCGAVLIGVGTGAMLLGLRWWVGNPQQELDARVKGFQPRADEQKEAERLYWGGTDYFGAKATEIVPAFFTTDFEQGASFATLQGAIAASIVLPRLGAAIFNIDGTLEPCNAILYEHVWNWKREELKSCVLHPPDEKTNILRCAEFVEKRKAKLRAKRIALGLSPDAPVSLDDMEEEDDEEDSEDEAEAEEFLRRAEHNKRAERFDTFKDINRRKKEDAEGDREKGAYLFKNGENEAALQKFEESIGKNPDEFRAHLNRAATFLKLDMPRRAVLSADRALHLTEGKEAKCYYRRAAAWLACGEFNECIADCDAAKRLEPADKAIAALRKKGEEERENATWGFSADSRAVEKLEEQMDDPSISDAEKAMLMASQAANSGGDWSETTSHVDACRTMLTMEEFNGNSIELDGGTMTLKWAPTKDRPDGKEKTQTPAMLDQRALFCIEEATKRSKLNTLTITGGCLGAWGTAFIARGARIEGAGLEVLSLVDCRLRAEGAASIASLLSRGSKLYDIDLSGNGIGDEGLNEIAKEMGKNEYLEKLNLSRNRITNKRMGNLGAALGTHPVLRVLNLSHNLIGYQGATYLASGVRESVSLQHLNISHNKAKADAVYRLVNVCNGHETMSTVDCRGLKLRKADRRKLEAHTRFTRLQVFVDPAPPPKPSNVEPVIYTNGPIHGKRELDIEDVTELTLEENDNEEEDDFEMVLEENEAPRIVELEPAVAVGEPAVFAEDEEDVLPSSLVDRTDMIAPPPEDAPPKEALPEKYSNLNANSKAANTNNEWSAPKGDITTRDWVIGFAKLNLW